MSELIKREDAIKATWHTAGYTDEERESLIRAIPAVEPKKGEWEYNPEAYPCGCPYGSYNCSVCGERVPDKTNFCPSCGADMRGEE